MYPGRSVLQMCMERTYTAQEVDWGSPGGEHPAQQCTCCSASGSAPGTPTGLGVCPHCPAAALPPVLITMRHRAVKECDVGETKGSCHH